MPPRPRPPYFQQPPLIEFGARVRRLRHRFGWSQEDLAHEADRHFSYVSSVERGERNVTLLTIQALAEALQVDPGVLLTTDEDAFERAVADDEPAG